MGTRRFTVAADKTPLPVRGPDVTAHEDLFDRWAFLHLLHEFSASSLAELAVPIDGGEVVLRKEAGFDARSRGGLGVEGTPEALTVTGITLDLRLGAPR
jgi:hypothetical protein